MALQIPSCQDAAVDCWVQRFYPTIEDLREAGYIRDTADPYSGFLQGLFCAPSAENLRSQFRRQRGKPSLGSFLWLPALVLVLWAAVLVPLAGPMIRVGHLLIGLVYSGLVATSTWVAWETVRFQLYPKLNAWLVGIAMTCWFATEILGETYNVQIGPISDVTFNFVWIFYGTTVVCVALSGYRWKPEQPST